ncbi:FxDxF family PEP-CTERM protein [Curvibacter sp. APW13]|uniref:FxDxF family PEP-CTERM protein n=1 Tax=Curvibacter sp. APW13 TaxID=3077236 RepID=UPI0028DE8A8B|nr:FxDxF family PEP-CTERM protein [Curvibacter sp. APW13]MDT8992582.1 FxDxF family PEP-CTERM protein [Curvibacter sp. APW13]
MRNNLVSLAIATALAGTGTAHAATYSVGDLTALGDPGYSQSTDFFAGTINDQYSFSISGGPNAFSSIASKLSLTIDQVITFASGQLTGPDAFVANLTPWVNSLGGFTVNGIGYEGLLKTGDYTLSLHGVSQKDGHYSVSMLAQPVPEPESIVLLMAGLGLIGGLIRRRNRHTEKVQSTETGVLTTATLV